MDDFLQEEESNSTIFESFSDVALCTLVVSLLLVSLLAISITQNINVEINRSKFSGGVMRPSLHLECTVPDFGETTTVEFAVERVLFSGEPYVAVHLFSPSLALIATDVRGGGTVALGEDETFAQQHDLSLYQFMQLAPGIAPGSFNAEGAETALLIPSILDKQMVYEPRAAAGYRVNADRTLTKRVLEALWPIYESPIYPARRPEEYSSARTRVYVETRTAPTAGGAETHHVVIGHTAYKLPDALDDGSLAWLGGFSSGLTEIVFLGETWSDPERETNRRIAFFEREGFDAAARAYRDYAFPAAMDGEAKRNFEKLVAAGVSRGKAERRARSAVAQAALSRGAVNGRVGAAENSDFIPPLLAHPEAWAEYIAYFEREQPDPPKWFYAEFLDRLGFDRLAIEGLRH